MDHNETKHETMILNPYLCINNTVPLLCKWQFEVITKVDSEEQDAAALNGTS